jgi:hypothetical protein
MVFGWGKSKKQSELRQMIDRSGIDAASQYCAEIVGKKMTTMEVFHQFILEELDSASQGNAFAQKFAKDLSQQCKISESDYIGALDRSFPEVDDAGGPQQTLLMMTMQLTDDKDLMVQFRTSVVRKLAEAVRVGKAEKTDVNSLNDIQKIIDQFGPTDGGEALRRLADSGNLICQQFFATGSLVTLESPGKHDSQSLQLAQKNFENYGAMAASNGDVDMQFNLGKYYIGKLDLTDKYLSDEDVEHITKAEFWFRTAKEHGLRSASDAYSELSSLFRFIKRPL